jgi:hypothetical protein
MTAAAPQVGAGQDQAELVPVGGRLNRIDQLPPPTASTARGESGSQAKKVLPRMWPWEMP